MPIMADDEHNPTLAELEEAFNIEKVTKEFFEKYRGLFIWTKEELDKAVQANPITKTDFENKGIEHGQSGQETAWANHLFVLSAKERLVWSAEDGRVGRRLEKFLA